MFSSTLCLLIRVKNNRNCRFLFVARTVQSSELLSKGMMELFTGISCNTIVYLAGEFLSTLHMKIFWLSPNSCSVVTKIQHNMKTKALLMQSTYSSQFLPAYPTGHASHVGRPSLPRKHVKLNLEREIPCLMPNSSSRYRWRREYLEKEADCVG